MLSSTEVFKDSWLYQEGVAAGLAESYREGYLIGNRDFIRLAINHNFPAMETPEIDQIVHTEVLLQLFESILDAQNADDVRAAVQAALRAT